jgi:16S rRNA (cytosine1402-N4)-methyltransferase
MRFDRTKGQTAAMLLASLDRLSLIALLKENGELRQAHRFADAIIRRRKTEPVRTTFGLKAAVLEAYGRTGYELLPQAFQAVRMAVNRELYALDILLKESMALLAPGGRFAVITFHSLEDRIVKNVFRTASTAEKDPITGAEVQEATFDLLSKKSITPSHEEIQRNPRSRSARLRAIRKRKDYTAPRY